MAPFAAKPDSSQAAGRTELLEHLNEREKLMQAYSASLQKHSGFFGQRTKADMKESQVYLEKMIDEDNRIISSLNRVLDYRNFEKTNYTYDANENEERLKNLQALSDTLNKQVDALQKENKRLNAQSPKTEIFAFLLIALLALAGIYYVRRSRRV